MARLETQLSTQSCPEITNLSESLEIVIPLQLSQRCTKNAMSCDILVEMNCFLHFSEILQCKCLFIFLLSIFWWNISKNFKRLCTCGFPLSQYRWKCTILHWISEIKRASNFISISSKILIICQRVILNCGSMEVYFLHPFISLIPRNVWPKFCKGYSIDHSTTDVQLELNIFTYPKYDLNRTWF